MNRSKVLAVVLLILMSTGLKIGTSSAAEADRCQLLENGTSGPRDDVLRLNSSGSFFDSVPVIAQEGEEITIRLVESYRDNFPQSYTRGRAMKCGFEKMTTSDIDRIDLILPRRSDGHLVVLDMSKARPGAVLAPGATPERSGSEIELRVLSGPAAIRPRGSIGYIGTQGPDRLDLAGNDGLPTVNFNPAADGSRPDADIRPGIAVGVIRVAGGPGRDETRPAIEGLEPLPDWVKLAVQGDAGNDRLLGHGGPDAMKGGPGEDLIRAFGGDDTQHSTHEWATFSLVGGPGRDRIFGGLGRDEIGSGGRGGGDAGSDEVYGGPGDDTFHGQQDGFRDRINCGSGKEKAFLRDRGLDQLTGCEMTR